MHSRIIAVDFDGTLCENVWPGIGEAKDDVINYVKWRRQKDGAKLILWTCRVGERLEEAIKWCAERGLEFDAVNENLPETLDWFGHEESRKIFAHEYLDDRSFSPVAITVGNMFGIPVDVLVDNENFLNRRKEIKKNDLSKM